MKKIIFAFFILAYMSSYAQDSVTMYMELPRGSRGPVTFMKDEYETEPTSIPDEFFDTPMAANYCSNVVPGQYILVLKFPKQYNFFVFKVEDPWSGKAIIGCFSTTKNSSFQLKSFDYVERDSIENSMELYRKARKLQSEGKNRKANKLYKQSAFIGNVLAMQHLAENYRNGVGCLRNTKKAYYWYEQASFLGDEYSASMIRGNSYRQKGGYSVMSFSRF